MDSRGEETILTSKFKMQGPKMKRTMKRIMTTTAPRKGRNQCPGGEPGFYLVP
jgi:hypothetical protein